MVEDKEKIPVTPDTIYRIEARLNLPGEPVKRLRTQADILIEDAIARREIAKAGKALKKQIEEGKS